MEAPAALYATELTGEDRAACVGMATGQRFLQGPEKPLQHSGVPTRGLGVLSPLFFFQDHH